MASACACSAHQRRLERLPPKPEPAPLDELLSRERFRRARLPADARRRATCSIAQTIREMKRTAWLINVGRGPVVRGSGAHRGACAKRIAGAMLDVYEHYRLRARPSAVFAGQRDPHAAPRRHDGRVARPDERRRGRRDAAHAAPASGRRTSSTRTWRRGSENQGRQSLSDLVPDRARQQGRARHRHRGQARRGGGEGARPTTASWAGARRTTAARTRRSRS